MPALSNDITVTINNVLDDQQVLLHSQWSTFCGVARAR
jgi:hypothetical protein